MKNSLRLQITDYLKEKRGQWVRKSDLEIFGRSLGYFGYTACRRTQEMTQPTHKSYNPDIEHQYKDGVVQYRYMPKSENSTPQTIFYPKGEVEATKEEKPYKDQNLKEFCCIENWRGQGHNKKCFKLK